MPHGSNIKPLFSILPVETIILLTLLFHIAIYWMQSLQQLCIGFYSAISAWKIKRDEININSYGNDIRFEISDTSNHYTNVIIRCYLKFVCFMSR